MVAPLSWWKAPQPPSLRVPPSPLGTALACDPYTLPGPVPEPVPETPRPKHPSVAVLFPRKKFCGQKVPPKGKMAANDSKNIHFNFSFQNSNTSHSLRSRFLHLNDWHGEPCIEIWIDFDWFSSVKWSLAPPPSADLPMAIYWLCFCASNCNFKKSRVLTHQLFCWQFCHRWSGVPQVSNFGRLEPICSMLHHSLSFSQAPSVWICPCQSISNDAAFYVSIKKPSFFGLPHTKEFPKWYFFCLYLFIFFSFLKVESCI